MHLKELNPEYGGSPKHPTYDYKLEVGSFAAWLIKDVELHTDEEEDDD